MNAIENIKHLHKITYEGYMSTKKVEVLIIENDYVIHHTSSQVYPDSNTYNVVIQALIENLTGAKAVSPVKAGMIPLTKSVPSVDKFAQAVPDYRPTLPEGINKSADDIFPPKQEALTTFHPDLVKEGVAPKVTKSVENGIPVVKLSMKEILKGVK